MIAVADQVRPTMPPLDRFVDSRRSSIATFDSESQIDEQGLEYVNGGYQEKVLGWESEWIAGEILSRLREFVRPRQLGWVIGSNASYQCFAEAFPE